MGQTRRASARIEVSRWDPKPFDQRPGAADLVRVEVEETFSGDLTGAGHATFLQVVAEDGSASFVGVERFVGSLAGREGSFALQDQGTLTADGKVAGNWFVVPGSGTEGLAGLRGDGGFQAELGQSAEAYIDYELD
jgi:Protein of unknown function (DUF3224)